MESAHLTINTAWGAVFVLQVQRHTQAPLTTWLLSGVCYHMCNLLNNMAIHSYGLIFSFSILFCMFAMAYSQLTSSCYESTCPQALSIIRSAVIGAVAKEHRMGASLLRLHFHDCFVNARFSSFFFISLSINLIYAWTNN